MKTISNRIIRKLNPCYDPSEVVKDKNEELGVKEWVAKYRDSVKEKLDIIWLLCNKLYMSDRDMRLFAVWCAREALSLSESPDPRSVEACNVAERYANGKATIKELAAARNAAVAATVRAANAARNAANAAARATREDASYAALGAAVAAAWAASYAASDNATVASAWAASRAAAFDHQIEQLLTYFK